MIPATQVGIAALLLLFWFLFTFVGADWVAVAFYVVSLILSILLISQFWTLANDVYDPRQAKRIFGFIGGGASLGGATGAGLTAFLVQIGRVAHDDPDGRRGDVACASAIVMSIVRREKSAGTSDASKTGEEEGVSGGEAHSAAALVAAPADHLAGDRLRGHGLEHRRAAGQHGGGRVQRRRRTPMPLPPSSAQLIVYLSLIGFVIQVTLTSRIHRILGIGFALLMLPVSMGAAATLILFNRALWAPSVGRIIDTSIRYTIDKTSREVLFLPLPADLKYRAKPFVDVTMDRLREGRGRADDPGVHQGLGPWPRLAATELRQPGAGRRCGSLTAIAARREYMRSFRRSIEQQIVAPAELRFNNPDPSSVETLVTELAHPDPRRALYAIDLLDAMDKRHLVTPLLLAHDSAEVRARALEIAESRGSRAGRSMAARRGTGAEGSRRRGAHRRGVGAGGAARRGRRRRDAAVHHRQTIPRSPSWRRRRWPAAAPTADLESRRRHAAPVFG